MDLGITNIGLDMRFDDEDGLPQRSQRDCPPNANREEKNALETLEDEETNQVGLVIGSVLEKFWTLVYDFVEEKKTLVHGVVYVLLGLLYNAYFVACIYYSIHNGVPIDWCNGVGLLIIITGISYLSLLYFQIVKRFWHKRISQNVFNPITVLFNRVWKNR